MVGTLKVAGSFTLLLHAQLDAPVPANVVEGADLSLTGTSDQHALAAYLDGPPSTGLVQVSGRMAQNHICSKMRSCSARNTAAST